MRDEYLRYINETLKEHDKGLAESFTEMKHPPVFILAMPRSASTLFTQLAVNMLDVGYVTNFLAKFYKAPVAGLMLEQEILDIDYKSGYQSEYGNTKGALEPHEWGWFWQDMLDLKGQEHYTTEERISKNLRSNICALTTIKDKPVLLDNVYAVANMHLIKRMLPEALAVHIERDLFYVCNSIINARVKRYGDINTFYGHRPKDIDYVLSTSNPIEQIVRQVVSIHREIEEVKSSFKDGEIFSTTYSEICSAPEKVSEDFAAFMKVNGEPLKDKEFIPPVLINRDDPKLVDSKYRNELIDMLGKYGVEYSGQIK